MGVWCIALIDELFEEVVHTHPDYSWTRRKAEHPLHEYQPIADLVAMRIMAYRCRVRPDRFQAWYARFQGGAPHPPPMGRAIEVVIETALGVPATPRSADHVQAFVAEHLWLCLVEDRRLQERTVSIEGPSVEVTETGGDGLVIHRTEGGDLAFRLWELKKHTARSHVSRTISGAFDQLSEKAERYLNKISLNGQYQTDLGLARFYGRLMDLWIAGEPSAAAGVAVALPTASVPTRAFTRFPQRFPLMRVPSRLRGLMMDVSDFSQFADQVREALWRGL